MMIERREIRAVYRTFEGPSLTKLYAM